MTKNPLVLIVIANDTEKSLRHLNEEVDGITTALQRAKSKGFCEIDTILAADPQKLMDRLKLHRAREVILHYAGHGEEDAIFVNSVYGETNAEDLAAFLANFNNIRLFFLNACLTGEQAKGYAAVGLPAVISTTRRIDDDYARNFARLFYQSLGSGAAIRTAFSEAKAGYKLTAGSGKDRSSFSSVAQENLHDPAWELWQQDDQNWQLPAFARSDIVFFTHTPPLPPDAFTGRETDLGDIDGMLEGDRPLVLVNGIGGVGKTTLAQAWWHAHVHRYTHAAWVDCPDGLVAGLRQSNLARKLNIDLEQVPADNDFWRLLSERMANTPGPNLLILDNANEADDLRLLQHIPNWHLLVTSRVMRNFPRLQQKSISELSLKAAQDLFLAYYPAADTTPDLLDRLLAGIGYHALTVEVLAKTLAGEYYEYTIEELYHQLQSKGLFGLKDTWEVETDWQRKYDQPHAIIASLYNTMTLPSDLQNLLLQLSCLPAIFIPLDHLLLMIGREKGEMIPALESLCHQGWLEKSKDPDNKQPRFKLHQVIQEVVRKGEPVPYETAQPLVEHVKDLLDGPGPLGPKLPYRTYLLPLAERVAGPHPRLAGMCWSALDMLIATGYLVEAIPFADLAEKQFESLGDQDGVGAMLNRKGNIALNLGKMSEAFEYYQKMADTYSSLFQANPQSESLKNGLAISYSKLGDLHQAQGNYAEALKYFSDEVVLFEELYASNPQSESLKNGLAISYSKLGDLHKAQGNYAEALKYFSDRSRLGEELYASNPQSESLKNGLAISYEKLGDLHKAQGNYAEALKYFSDEVVLFEELYASNPQSYGLYKGVGISYVKMAEVYQEMGKPGVKAFYEKSLAIFEALHQQTELPEPGRFAEIVRDRISKLNT